MYAPDDEAGEPLFGVAVRVVGALLVAALDLIRKTLKTRKTMIVSFK